jgi:hypothetical protein
VQLYWVQFFFSTTIGSDTSAATTMPEFRSGVSTELGVAVDFDVLESRVGAIYDVIESDDTHIIWKFTGTTGDWAFVYTDGRLVVASMVDFDLSAKDALEKEMNDVIDMLNAAGGSVSSADREHAIDHASYYAGEAGVYHRTKYKYNTPFNLHLTVPKCTVNMARLTIAGAHAGNGEDYEYALDGSIITSCSESSGSCYVSSPVDITSEIPYGVHTFSQISYDHYGGKHRYYSFIGDHTIYIEAYTSPAAKNMVLYSDDYSIWIEETTKSLTLDKLTTIIGPCYPREINIEAMQPESNFNVIKATAVPISVNVTESCGNVIDSASVQVAFENGDTTLLLAHVNDGIYNGTWVPWNVGHCNVTITAIPPSWQTLEPESVIINGTVSML